MMPGAAATMLSEGYCTSPPDKGELATRLREAARLGHVDAQWTLGLALRDGDGIPADAEEALSWFRKAAAENNECAWNFGTMLSRGDRLPSDQDEALHWLKIAATRVTKITRGGVEHTITPSPVRQFELAMMLRDGKLLPKNDTDADELFRRAADGLSKHQNSDECAWRLGIIYRDGLGIAERNPKQATEWFERAARNAWHYEGFDAQVELGVMHRDGIGVPQNSREARRWFCMTLFEQRAAGTGARRRARAEFLKTLPCGAFIEWAWRRAFREMHFPHLVLLLLLTVLFMLAIPWRGV
jgi:hypothetical protein